MYSNQSATTWTGWQGIGQMAALLSNLLKLRIGLFMVLTALVAMAATPGPAPTFFQVLVLTFAILVSAGSAGAFNQYYEVDLDRAMPRTRNRPFVTGRLPHRPAWLPLLLILLVVGVASAALALNAVSALHIFLGAFFYAIVYTVWLKRRTWWNIVIGGASGSFAVLAGAAAVDPVPGPVPLLLALALFLWTPSHFWSLAIARIDDYRDAAVPMLPVIVGRSRAARIVLVNTLLLVTVSLLPAAFGLGWIYFAFAALGGGWFLVKNIAMVRDPSPRVAMKSFLASLVQLLAMLAGAVLDVLVLG